MSQSEVEYSQKGQLRHILELGGTRQVLLLWKYSHSTYLTWIHGKAREWHKRLSGFRDVRWVEHNFFEDVVLERSCEDGISVRFLRWKGWCEWAKVLREGVRSSWVGVRCVRGGESFSDVIWGYMVNPIQYLDNCGSVNGKEVLNWRIILQTHRTRQLIEWEGPGRKRRGQGWRAALSQGDFGAVQDVVDGNQRSRFSFWPSLLREGSLWYSV